MYFDHIISFHGRTFLISEKYFKTLVGDKRSMEGGDGKNWTDLKENMIHSVTQIDHRTSRYGDCWILSLLLPQLGMFKGNLFEGFR